MNVERHCQFCGAKITDCNGFVNAGEFARLLNGEKIVPREFCGRCDVRMMLEADSRGEAVSWGMMLPHAWWLLPGLVIGSCVWLFIFWEVFKWLVR